MGADLYLSSVLQECYTRYGHLFHLATTAHCLASGDLAPALEQESQRLKEALQLHATEAGIMSPALFDLVAEITDLAQGISAVWAGALANHLVEVVGPLATDPSETADGTGPSGLVCLAQDLVDLLNARPEPAIRHGAGWLARHLGTMARQSTKTEEASLILTRLGQSMLDLLTGNPARALALLVERRMLPALARICADQANDVQTLTQALEPLLPADIPPTKEAALPVAQALAHWRDLALRLQSITEDLQTHLAAALEEAALPIPAITGALALAGARIGELWQDIETLLPELAAAMETLGSLLLRTLPPPDQVLERQPEAQTSVTDNPPPAPSPLRQVFGIILRQRAICQEASQLIGRCTQTANRLLEGELTAGLKEICRELAVVLRSQQQSEPEPPLSAQIAASTPFSVPLASGVTLFPGTLMDSCYVQIQTLTHQQVQHLRSQEWISHVLEDEPLLSPAGLVLRFWRLVIGQHIPWAQLVLELIREALLQEHGHPVVRAEAIALVDQLQGVLTARPVLRLQVLLHDLEAMVTSSSPLLAPAVRLAQLVRGEADEAVTTALDTLSHEVQCLCEQAGVSAQEQQRLADLDWLLELAHALVRAPEEGHTLLLSRTLLTLCVACLRAPADEAEAAFTRRLLEVVRQHSEELRPAEELHTLLESLAEVGPQPPRTDPRLVPLWRFRLLAELISLHLRLEEQREVEQQARTDSPFALLTCVLQMISRVLDAWIFSPTGYFRDPYNDSSILWVTTDLFWPALAEQIAEPRDEHELSVPWMEEEGEIPAQIPLAMVRELRSLVQEGELRLPSFEHLARWGSRTIRVEEQGPYSLSAWHAYFAQRRHSLLAFLDEAIAREEPILCAL